MGSVIEIKDTLKISKREGFPMKLDLERHVSDPEFSRDVVGEPFKFFKDVFREEENGNEPYPRYHDDSARVFLVEDINGKWLYWGNAVIESQTVGNSRVEGVYRITKVYQPDFQQQMTIEESPPGKSFFEISPSSYVEE